MKLPFALLLTLSCFYLPAQNPGFEKLNPAGYEAAHFPGDVTYMSAEEKEVLYLINLARINPKLFSDTFLKFYLDSTGENDKWTRSLQKELMKRKPVQPLSPAEDLFREAENHAMDMGESGKSGHNTSSGKGPRGRFKNLLKKYHSIGENCDYGHGRAIDIVMALLIDKNISSLGHRKNILSPKFYYAGIAIRRHKKLGWNCVIDFGGK